MDIQHTLALIGRTQPLFTEDVETNAGRLDAAISNGNFLVIGGAGSVGQAVAREIFKRRPRKLHLVDVSENEMVEVVRDIRSTLGYVDGDFRTFSVDCGSGEFDALVRAEGPYDHVLNLSALKHVRSEKDPYTLMRMIDVNVFNTVKTIRQARLAGAGKYFCVSTDKAANPVNMMGASKRIMELFLMRESRALPVSTARFANVAFSNGSLLHGFNQRVAKQQPIAAPRDVRRYFVTPQESGELCLVSCLLGGNREIYFPKLNEKLHLTTFSDIAVRYLRQLGYEPVECATEDEARSRAVELIPRRRWPCYFFDSDTAGEKDFEEFFMADEDLVMDRYKGIGVIRTALAANEGALEEFEAGVRNLRARGQWSKQEIVAHFARLLPEFAHKETGKYLDQRM